MNQLAPCAEPASDGRADSPTPIAAALMAATLALAALGGAAVAGLQSLIGA